MRDYKKRANIINDNNLIIINVIYNKIYLFINLI